MRREGRVSAETRGSGSVISTAGGVARVAEVGDPHG
jgi:hypothetical protein